MREHDYEKTKDEDITEASLLLLKISIERVFNLIRFIKKSIKDSIIKETIKICKKRVVDC